MTGDDDGDLSAHARRTDPWTSHAAAGQVTKIRESQEAILAVLRAHGPLTDDGIFALLADHQSPSGARTRRAELVELGKVEDTGATERLKSGRQSKIWRAKP